MTISKRLDDLEAGIKNKQTRDDKAKWIEVRSPDGWIETYNLVTGEITRVRNHDEQSEQASERP